MVRPLANAKVELSGRLRGVLSMTSGRRREGLIGVALIVPALGLIFLVIGLPVIRALQLSVNRYQITEGINSEHFCGICNFIAILDDPFLATYVRNQILFMVGTTFLPILFGLGVALLLNRPLRLRWVWRAVVLVPWTMPVAAAAVTWRWLFDQQWGIFNYYLVSSGAVDKSVGFLTDPVWLWPSILLVSAWMWFPYNYVAILAALQGISPDLYEAGRMDGTNAWTAFRHITLPAIRPLLAILIILGLIWASNDFTTIFLLTQGGPGVESTTVAPLVFKTLVRYYDFGKAAAIGVVMMAVSVGLALIYLRRAGSEYQ